jgi:hypothetical protein
LWENAKFELSELLVGIHWALTKRWVRDCRAHHARRSEFKVKLWQ